MFRSHIWDEKRESRNYIKKKNLLKLDKKKWITISPKKIYKWPIRKNAPLSANPDHNVTHIM